MYSQYELNPVDSSNVSPVLSKAFSSQMTSEDEKLLGLMLQDIFKIYDERVKY